MKRLYRTRVRWLGLFTRNLGHYCEQIGLFDKYNNYTYNFNDIRIDIYQYRERNYYKSIFHWSGNMIIITYNDGAIEEAGYKIDIKPLGDLINRLRNKNEH